MDPDRPHFGAGTDAGRDQLRAYAVVRVFAVLYSSR